MVGNGKHETMLDLDSIDFSTVEGDSVLPKNQSQMEVILARENPGNREREIIRARQSYHWISQRLLAIFSNHNNPLNICLESIRPSIVLFCLMG